MQAGVSADSRAHLLPRSSAEDSRAGVGTTRRLRLGQAKGDEMKIVVIGGTGLIGSKLVEKLRGSGHEPLAASPETGVNALTGEGLAEALETAQVVVDVANAPSWEDTAV